LNYSNTLFDATSQLEHINLLDAQLQYCPEFLSKDKADQLFQTLMRDTAWKHEQIQIAGIARWQPRLTAWIGNPEASYEYSGLMMKPTSWTASLLEIKQEIETATNTSFNSVLLNLYRDQQDSMGWHSDDERELGSQPVIASLSLGETRRFGLKHKTEKRQRFQLALNHGSLLVMGGDTQKHWLHSIAKENANFGPRINLTFRRIFSNRQ
jgi:alkylated DNA repair dioxygenase AlkB